MPVAHEQEGKAPCKADEWHPRQGYTFADAELLLLGAGFVLDGGEGSHRVYRHPDPDARKMVLAFHGKDVKPAYIQQIRQLLK